MELKSQFVFIIYIYISLFLDRYYNYIIVYTDRVVPNSFFYKNTEIIMNNTIFVFIFLCVDVGFEYIYIPLPLMNIFR